MILTLEPRPFAVPGGWVVLAEPISEMIACARCKGTGLLDGELSPRCEKHPGVDPESFCGCDEHDEDPERQR